MAPSVAGLSNPNENIAQGAIVGVLPEARETAHLHWDTIKISTLF